MGKRYLIDTNIAIYLLDGNMPLNTIDFLEKVIDNEYFISVISKMELLGFDFSDAAKNEITAAFVGESSLIQLTEKVIERTIALRKVKKMKLPDAIIAATALAYDLVLVSRNEKDFDKIPNLEYINPYNLQ
jgi:predicted nucleic acid-binding protein